MNYGTTQRILLITFFSLLFSFLTVGIALSETKKQQDEEEQKIRKELMSLSLDDLVQIEIEGSSKYKQKPSEAPSTILTITRQQIEQYGYRDISDVLNNVPAIDVTSNVRFGDFYSVRGINGNDRFLILINGRRLNPAMGTMLAIGRSIPIIFADRIEIIYGASSIMYGTDAFSAIINIIFTSPEFSSAAQGNAYASYGTFGTIQAGGNVDIPLGNDVTLKAWGRIFSSDGFVPTADTAIRQNLRIQPNGEYAQPIHDHNFFAELAYKNLRLGLFRKYFDEGNGRGLLPTGYIMSEKNRWISENNTLWADYATKVFDGKLTIDMSYHLWQLAPETMFYKEPGPNPFEQYMTGRDRMLRTLATFVRQSENIDIIVGAQFDHISSIPSYANDQLFGGKPVKFEGAEADSIEKALTIKERRGGIFAQITYRLDSTLSFIAGGRYDFSQLFDNTFNPRLAFVSHILPTTSVKLIYSTAFQAPSLFYKYEQFGTPSVVMVPAIEQERGLLNQHVTTLEAEITHRLQSVLFTANIYHTTGENLIERERYADSVYNKYFNTFTPAIRNNNTGSKHIWGGYIHAVFHISSSVSGYAHYSYTHARRKVSATLPDVAAPRVAEHKFGAGISIQNIFNALTISPSIRWVGAQNNILPLTSTIPTIPGYAMVNIHAVSNVIADRIQIFTSVENLLDSRIEQVGIFGGIPYQDKVLQPGFVWNAGLSVQW